MQKISLVFLSLLLASCTLALWMDNHYEETIRGVYIEKNSNKLVALGENYHYIFDVDDYFIDTIDKYEGPLLRPVFYDFTVSDGNRISGDLSLYAGGKRVYKGRLVGTRYQPSDVSAALEKARKTTYQLRIRKPETAGWIAKNIALSPVTAVADAGLVAIALPTGVLIQVLGLFEDVFEED